MILCSYNDDLTKHVFFSQLKIIEDNFIELMKFCLSFLQVMRQNLTFYSPGFEGFFWRSHWATAVLKR